MNIIISKEDLLWVLSKINTSFSNKSDLFSNQSALFEFGEKKLKVSATDLELSLIAEISITNKEKKSVCLPYKKLFMLVKEINASQLEIEIEQEKMSIRCEKCEYNLNGFSKDRFPKIPTLKDKIGIKISSEVVLEMIDMTRFCTFSGESNYVLGGVLLELEKNEIRMVATDGKRLAYSKKKISPNQPELNKKISVIVPLRAINELKRTAEGEILLVLGESQVEFDNGRVKIISQLIEGEYPEYSKYIPPAAKNKIKVRRQDLLASLKRVSILATSDYPGIKIELGKNKMVVSKATPNLGELKEELEIEYSGPPLNFGFNPQYLVDVLKVVGGEFVEWDVYGSEKPLVLRKADYIYLALPMRLE